MRFTAEPHAVKNFVAKLVKSFGRLVDAAESLDDFRYTKARFKQEKIVHGVGQSPGTRQRKFYNFRYGTTVPSYVSTNGDLALLETERGYLTNESFSN